MKISTTTSFTLTAAEIQEAVKQFIQANGYELDDKDVEFVSELPQETIVKVTESTTNQNQEQQPHSPASIEGGVVDYSTLEDMFTPPSTNGNEIPQKPRRWNPFLDESKDELDEPIPHHLKQTDRSAEGRESRAQEVIPVPTPRHLMFK